MKYVNKQFVRWDDLDAMTHVNNAKYLTFAQEARFVWSTAVFTSAMNASTLIEMVVARAEVDFIEPIYEGGRFVDVEISVEKIGTSSFVVLYTIGDEGKVFAKVKTVQVAISLETKKSRPLTEKEREFLSKYLETN
ncbi:MAG: thioesterase family protein [Actinobacteria bacterium]|nr:thioesterase family protein [Actinomycetota bacterium]